MKKYMWKFLTSQVALLVKKLPAMQETQVRSLGQEDALEKEMTTHSIFVPGEFHGQRRLVGYSSWGRKESDMTEQLSLHFICKFLAKCMGQ